MKSKFTAKDFDDLKYNVVSVPKSSTVLEKFPELKKYPEFTNGKLKNLKASTDKIIRYGFLMFTDNVIHRLIEEIPHRKREAAILAGIDSDEYGKFAEMYEMLFRCEYALANEIFIRIGRISNNAVFNNIRIYQEARSKEMLKMLDGADSKELKTVHENINRLTEDINRYEKDFLKEDVNDNLLERMYSQIEGVTLGITPEENAKLKKDGKFENYHRNVDPYKNSKTRGR